MAPKLSSSNKQPPSTPPKKKVKTSHASTSTASPAGSQQQSTLNSFFKSPNAVASGSGSNGGVSKKGKEKLNEFDEDPKEKGKEKDRREAHGEGVIDLEGSSEEEGGTLDGSKLTSNGLLDDSTPLKAAKSKSSSQTVVKEEDIDMVSISSGDETETKPTQKDLTAKLTPNPNRIQSKSKETVPLAAIFQRKRKSSQSPPPGQETKPKLKKEEEEEEDKPLVAVDYPSAFGPAKKFVGLEKPSNSSTGLVSKLDVGEGDGEDIKPSQNEQTQASSSASGSSLSIDFDQDPLLFRPENMDLRGDWPNGKVPYEVLVGVYVAVGGTRSRLMIGRILTNFLRLLIIHAPEDLLPTIYLLSNHLSPSYISLELGIGSSILSRTIKEVSGCSASQLKVLWSKWGDPGDVAFEAKSSLRTLVKPAKLMVRGVYESLVKIAKVKGTGGQKGKGEIVRRLLVQARGEEVRYLVRTLCAHLRIGAVKLTLLSALARAFVLTRTPTCTDGDISTSLHTSSSEMNQIRPLPVKTKGKGKAKEEVDEVRELVEGKMVEGTAVLRRVYARHPNYEDILKGLLEGGLENLGERVPLSVGIPLSPMLGSITRSLAEVFTRLGTLPFTSEAKLDGQRVQIHARTKGPSGVDDGGGKWVEGKMHGLRVWVRLFSRHLEDMTEKYPDVTALIACLLERTLPSDRSPFSSRPDLSRPSPSMLELLRSDKIESFVMDAEIVAVDKDTGAYRTFQDLSNRAKKDVKMEDVKVIVGVFAFDLMLINDVPLLHESFSIRRHLLRTLFQPFQDTSDPTIARFSHVESIDSTKPEDVQSFFDQVIAQKCEGLMVKLLESGEGIAGEDEDDADDVMVTEIKNGKGKKASGPGGGGGKKKPLPSTYEPDARSQGWLKVKKDYLEGMGDSLDLVPIGAWWGLGRKAGWWSPILLACLNPDTGALEAVCKCISGFTDQFYKDLLVRFPPEGKPEVASKAGPLAYIETGGYRPDIYFAPTEVWEIRGADISLSPVYPAAASHLGSERGLSMRFPRFIRLREDKGWEDATTSAQFADMYRKQIKAAPARAEAPGGQGGDVMAEKASSASSPQESEEIVDIEG